MLAQFIPGMIVTYIKDGAQAVSETSNQGKLKVKHPEKGGGTGGAGGGAGTGTGTGTGVGEGQHRSSKRISLVTGAGLKTARFGCIVKGPFHLKATSNASRSASSTPALTPALTPAPTAAGRGARAGVGAGVTSAALGSQDSAHSSLDEMVVTLMIGLGDEVRPF